MSKKSLTLFAALGIAAAAGAAYAVRWWFDGTYDASRHSLDPERRANGWRDAGAARDDEGAMSDWDDETEDLFEPTLTPSERAASATKAKTDDREVADMAAAVLTDADLSIDDAEPIPRTKRASTIRKQQSPSEVPVAGR
ncbi:MAG TPA: hypothetical protein VFR11_18530 [Micromonosporaceae bacterium]|jgi:hypothetical protein|nr:hypothetical protein [Micromonosporaceae bacterium]